MCLLAVEAILLFFCPGKRRKTIILSPCGARIAANLEGFKSLLEDVEHLLFVRKLTLVELENYELTY